MYDDIFSYNFFHRTVSVPLAVQVMNEQMLMAKFDLEKLCMQGQEELGEEDEKEVNLLRKQLARSDTMRPLGYFSLNKGSLLSLTGTVITYCIILMQFKQAKF